MLLWLLLCILLLLGLHAEFVRGKEGKSGRLLPSGREVKLLQLCREAGAALCGAAREGQCVCACCSAPCNALLLRPPKNTSTTVLSIITTVVVHSTNSYFVLWLLVFVS